MLVAVVETSGALSIWSAEGRLCSLSGFRQLLDSDWPGRVADRLSQAVRSVGRGGEDSLVLIVPGLPPAAEAIEAFAGLLAARRVRLLGVAGALAEAEADRTTGAVVVAHQDDGIVLVDSSSGAVEEVSGWSMASAAFALAREICRREMKVDLVRLGLDGGDVLDAMVAATLDADSACRIGKGEVSIEIERSLLEQFVGALAHGLETRLRDAMLAHPRGEGATLIIDEIMHRWLSSTTANPSARSLRIAVRGTASVAREALREFGRREEGNWPAARCIGRIALTDAPVAQSSPPRSDTPTRPRIPLRVAVPWVVFQTATLAWAVVATWWAASNGGGAGPGQTEPSLPNTSNSEDDVSPGPAELATPPSDPVASPSEMETDSQPMRAGEVRQTTLGIEIAWVPSGGDAGVWLAVHELSESEHAFAAASGSASEASRPKLLTFDEAVQYCHQASERDSEFVYEIPHAPDWRWACLAGGDGPLGRGVDAHDVNSADRFAGIAARDDVLGRNEWQFVGMNGNLPEWVQESDGHRLAGGGADDDGLAQCGCGDFKSVESNAEHGDRDQTPALGGLRVMVRRKSG